ncbi:hypothetical protein MO973_44105 [Paenibacillus sp. TRM 82003]|nr:hypothetical protein [Paenibacillus sp. TRM 82003]
MFFESEYRRQAMEKWQSSRAETERELLDDLRESHEHMTRFVEGLRNRLLGFLPHGRSSHNRFE